MKKITLVLLSLLTAVLLLGACSEKEEAVVKEPVKEEVKEEPKEEVKEEPVVEEVKEEPKTEDATTTLNYENTNVVVQNKVSEVLENINTILVYGSNQFPIEVIKSWFGDFEASDKVLDVYGQKLVDNGLEEKDLTQRNTEFVKVEEIEKNVWNVDLKMTGSNGTKTMVTNWNILAQPSPTGDLIIDVKEIK